MPADAVNINELFDEFRKAIQNLNQAQAEILAQRLSAAFVLGWRATRTGQDISWLKDNAIAKLSSENYGYLSEFNEALHKQMKTKILDLVSEGKGYNAIKKEMKPFLRELMGPEGKIIIDRTGQMKRVIELDQTGKLIETQKMITQPYQASLETYSDMLSRTVTHKGYTQGRREGYKSQGFTHWRYVSAGDERTRQTHAQLDGRVFEIDTYEEELALAVMSEPNCRCRQIAVVE